jgi:hypothetical protein
MPICRRKASRSKVAQILAVRENAARMRIVKARNHAQQRAFARAGHAENADDLAGLASKEISAAPDFFPVVAERHLFESDLSGEPPV